MQTFGKVLSSWRDSREGTRGPEGSGNKVVTGGSPEIGRSGKTRAGEGLRLGLHEGKRVVDA